MNKKIGDVIRILLGCYLIFLGVCLWIQVSKAGPTDEQLMTLFAVILIAVGIVSFLVSVLALTDGLKGKGYFRKKKRKSYRTILLKFVWTNSGVSFPQIRHRTKQRKVRRQNPAEKQKRCRCLKRQIKQKKCRR